jgi:hypothetical protein
LVTAALGLGLVTTWTLGLAYNGPAWLIWPDAAAALVALAATGMVEGGDLAGVTTWPLVGVTLCALWLFGLGSDAHWMAWLNLVLGLGFLALTGVTLLRAAGLPRLSHRRDLSHRRPLWLRRPLWHRRHQQAPA